MVYFSKPNKKLYLDIVHELAQRENLDIDENELDLKAEAFALAKISRWREYAKHMTPSLVLEKIISKKIFDVIMSKCGGGQSISASSLSIFITLLYEKDNIYW